MAMPPLYQRLRDGASATYRGWMLYADRNDGHWCYYAKEQNGDEQIGLCKTTGQLKRFIDIELSSRKFAQIMRPNSE